MPDTDTALDPDEDTGPVSETWWFDTLPEPDRRYPVVIASTITQYRIAWVDEVDSAEQAVAAVKRAAKRGDLHDFWEYAEEYPAGDEADIAIAPGSEAGWTLRDYFRDRPAGPVEACAGCGNAVHRPEVSATALRWAVDHAKTCPAYVHRGRVRYPALSEDPPRWTPGCSCDADLGGPRDTKDDAAAAVRDHCLPRPHGTMIPLGLPGRDAPILRAGVDPSDLPPLRDHPAPRPVESTPPL